MILKVLKKGWTFLRERILTVKVFDLFLQGAFLMVILMENNIYLLLRRDSGDSYIPSVVEDVVIVGMAGVEFLLGALLAWLGATKRNFALSGCLTATTVSGLLVLAFPFSRDSPGDVELCNTNFIPSDEDPNLTGRTIFLVITAVFCTLSKVSVWAHGLTYLDDHDPQNGPYFYGILISIRMSLGYSGQNWLIAASRTENWWKAQLSIAMLVFMFAVLFTLFPKRTMKNDDYSRVSLDFFPTLKRVIKNRVVRLQTLSLALLSFAVFGFIHYDRAYVQASFNVEAYRQDPQTSRTLSDIFRSLVIIFFVMIFRIRFSLNRADGVKATTASRVGGVSAFVVAVLLAALAGLACEGDLLSDGNHKGYTQPDCSMSCQCDSMRYGMSPVCQVDSMTTYFSPCHAGCRDVESLNGFLVFSNCTCALEADRRVVRGACTVDQCRTAFGAYQVVYTVMVAVAASSLMMQGMTILRAVRRSDKPTAVGASFAVVALITFGIGHAAYFVVSYFTCAYLNAMMCVLHNRLLWTMLASSSVLAALSAALSLYTSTARTHPEPTTEL